MEMLVFWSYQVLRYLNLKRISVGLNEEEKRLLNGLEAAIDQATEFTTSAPPDELEEKVLFVYTSEMTWRGVGVANGIEAFCLPPEDARVVITYMQGRGWRVIWNRDEGIS